MHGALISFFFIPVFEQYPVTFGSRDNLQLLNQLYISTERKNQHVSQSLKSTCLALLRKSDVALAFCAKNISPLVLKLKTKYMLSIVKFHLVICKICW